MSVFTQKWLPWLPIDSHGYPQYPWLHIVTCWRTMVPIGGQQAAEAGPRPGPGLFGGDGGRPESTS